MVKLTEEQERGNPLRVTRGDGIPLEDQAAAIAAFKRQATQQPQKPTLPLRLHSLVGGTSYILDANNAWVCTGPTPMLERILEAFALAATTE